MKPTMPQLEALTRAWDDFRPVNPTTIIDHLITHWESIRPKDQVSPEPTLDKIERAEFEAVMSAKFPEFCWASDFSQGAFEGWKAAKNQQTISA